MFKKLLTSFLIATTLFLSLGPFSVAKAQTLWYNQSPFEWYAKVYDDSNPNEIFGERYTASQVQWIAYSMLFLPVNTLFSILQIPTTPLVCVANSASGTVDIQTCLETIPDFIKNASDKLNLASLNQSSTLAQNSNQSLLSQIFNDDRQFSGITYIKNTINKFSHVATVKAQDSGAGYGMAALGSISFIWKITRNMAYFFFVIVTVVFAFMIMFRVKLSPQTVVTVQSSLPKIVVALILVTFSFAIAGLLIDVMYVFMGILAMFLSPFIAESKDVTISIFNFMNASNFGGGLALVVYFLVYLVLYIIALVFIAVAAVFGLNVSSAVLVFLLLIFGFVLILILIWNVFKITFILYKNLATIYGLVIIAPLQITLGVIYPQSGFGAWAKKFISKLVIFPLTGAFIYLAIILLLYSMYMSETGIVYNNAIMELLRMIGIATNDFSLPVGSWAPPMLGNSASAGGIAFLLMSVGLIMMIPKISESIDSFLAGKGIAGTGIGEAMGPFGGLAKTVGGTASSLGTAAGAEFLAEKLGKGRENSKIINKIVSILNSYASQATHGAKGTKTPEESSK